MAESIPNGELAPGEARVLDIHPTREEAGGLLAFVNVEFGGWIVRGIKLMRGKTAGTWLSWPARKDAGGDWWDICFVADRTSREKLHAAVEHAYQDAMATGGRDSGGV